MEPQTVVTEIKPEKAGMAPGRKKQLAGAIGALVVVAALVAWYALAVAAVNRHIQAFETGIGGVAAAKAKVADNSRPRDGIDFDELSAYVSAFHGAATGLEAAAARVRSGEGAGIWLPDRRTTEADRLDSRIRSEREFVQAATQALAAVDRLHQETAAVVNHARSEYERATAALAPQSDSADFQREAAAMSRSLEEIADRQAALRPRQRSNLSGAAEVLRQSLVSGLSTLLDTESGRLKARRQTLQQADRELARYKAAAAQIGGSNRRLLSGLGTVSTVLMPAVNFSFEKTRNLRNFVDEAEKPLWGDAGAALSSLFRRRSPGPVTAVSLVSEFYPGTGIMFTCIKDLCAAIERTHGEISELSNMVSGILPPLRDFLSGGTRAELSSLAGSAPPAAGYFEARRGLFNPPVENMEKVRPKLAEIAAFIGRIPMEKARSFLQTGIGVAAAILDAAEKPFRDGNDLIEGTAASMREIERQETAYVQALNSLRSQSSSPAPPAEAGNSIRDVDFKKLLPADGQGYEVVSVVYGDLTRDGIEEAAVTIGCAHGAGGFDTEVKVYSMRGSSAEELGKVEGGDRSMGSIRSVQIRDELLVVDQNRASDNAPMCCPDFAEVSTFAVEEGRLVRQGTPERRKLEEQK